MTLDEMKENRLRRDVESEREESRPDHGEAEQMGHEMGSVAALSPFDFEDHQVWCDSRGSSSTCLTRKRTSSTAAGDVAMSDATLALSRRTPIYETTDLEDMINDAIDATGIAIQDGASGQGSLRAALTNLREALAEEVATNLLAVLAEEAAR